MLLLVLQTLIFNPSPQLIKGTPPKGKIGKIANALKKEVWGPYKNKRFLEFVENVVFSFFNVSGCYFGP